MEEDATIELPSAPAPTRKPAAALLHRPQRPLRAPPHHDLARRSSSRPRPPPTRAATLRTLVPLAAALLTIGLLVGVLLFPGIFH
ncbi:MAG: hypothetical protein R3B70_17205 [Polyangiaceae bacterium]